jgi:hypothetical protein
MDNPFDLKEANGLTLIIAILLLGMTRVLTYAEFWDSFPILKKRATEEFIASNQSKKMVNVTVHFIT